MEAAGIKETREALALVAALAGAIKEAAGDGKFEVADLFTLLGDDEVRSTFLGAVQGIQNVPAEVQDLDLAEIRVLVDDAFAIVEALVGQGA